MSTTLWVSGAIACLLVGAGFLFADGESPRAAQAAGAPASVPPKPPAPAALRVVWPTPYPYFENKAAPRDFLQATVSGKVESGGYGMVRNGGARFHEGIDIRPVGRDRKGEPTDPVRAALAGRIAYLNAKPNGDYGRYIVLEHKVGGLTLYTLYAHLAAIDPTLREGRAIAAGERLGVMGRSNGSGGFPADRAHLHFEIGLRLSDNFARWYTAQRYPDPNHHGDYNGLNLAGLDPVGFFEFARERRANVSEKALADWVASQSVAVCVETRTGALPNLLRRNPALIVGGKTPGPGGGWRIGFTAEGVPVRWEAVREAPTVPTIAFVSSGESTEARRRGLVVAGKKRGAYAVGSTLEKALALALE